MTRPLLVATLRRLFSTLLTTSRSTLGWGVFVTLGLSLTEGAGLLLLLPLIQLVGVDAGTSQSGLGASLAKAFAAVGLRPTLATVLVVYVTVAGLQSVLQRWQNVIIFDIQENTVAKLRARMYRAIARTEWVAFSRIRSSEFTHVLTSEIDRCGMATYSLADLVVSSVIALVYLGLAFRLSPGMTALVLACGLLLAFAVRNKFLQAHASGRQISDATAALYSAIVEHLGGMKTAKSYGASGRHAEVFERLSDELHVITRRNVLDYAGLRQSLAVGSLIALAVIVYVSRAVLAVPTAPLLVLLYLFGRLMPKLTSLYEKTQTLLVLLPGYEAVSELEQRCEAAAEPRIVQRRDLPFTRSVRFENASFTYRADGPPAVCDVSMTIEAGQTTAIVGPSGSGKSTLADMLLGLLPPSHGVVRVDDEVLAADGLDAWRTHIGYVPQDAFLFHDTIRQNLLWATPDATEDDLWRALRLASADDFVRALPQGLDTVVGDRGVLVSGGERQRLALARALARRPNLLILDEATSALDSENERRIQQAVDDLHHAQTIVIITHRLSTIRRADRIYVLDHGTLVESGTWDELLARPRSRFRALHDAQEVRDTADAVEVIEAAR